jgi:hypothetical protein
MLIKVLGISANINYNKKIKNLINFNTFFDCMEKKLFTII